MKILSQDGTQIIDMLNVVWITQVGNLWMIVGSEGQPQMLASYTERHHAKDVLKDLFDYHRRDEDYVMPNY